MTSIVEIFLVLCIRQRAAYNLPLNKALCIIIVFLSSELCIHFFEISARHSAQAEMLSQLLSIITRRICGPFALKLHHAARVAGRICVQLGNLVVDVGHIIVRRSFAGVQANTPLRNIVALTVVFGVRTLSFRNVFTAFSNTLFRFLLILESIDVLLLQLLHNSILPHHPLLLIVSFLCTVHNS